jgi:hypothetical protein
MCVAEYVEYAGEVIHGLRITSILRSSHISGSMLSGVLTYKRG